MPIGNEQERLTASAESSKSSVCHDYAIRARASCRRTILQGFSRQGSSRQSATLGMDHQSTEAGYIQKLGISKDTELVLYMFCERMKINFDIKEIRKHGLELFFSILFLVIAALDFHPDMKQCSRAKTRTTQISRTRRTKTDSDYELYS